VVAYGSIQAMSGHGDAPGWQSIGSRKAASQQERRVAYHCPACGAPLAEGADVSPHGDAKCTHCGSWFNIHKSQA
jgi:DNA-directed RNA polymerase subunit RPC12/RpoP